MDNSYLADTGEVLGYCSIVPKVGEDHMFGNMIVYFAYEDEGKLYFSKHKSVKEDDEAEFIQDYLIKCGSFSTIEDIKLVIEAQTEYLKSVDII